ncbi:MAG: hypothetical protein WCC81_10840, partial [Pseudolabrys sp.]
SGPITIRKARLHLPNTSDRDSTTNDHPNINAVALPEAIKNHQRAQGEFYKNYKTAHAWPPFHRCADIFAALHF